MELMLLLLLLLLLVLCIVVVSVFNDVVLGAAVFVAAIVYVPFLLLMLKLLL